MAQPKQKIVKVDDSIIAFPDAMPDEHVARVIKSFRAKKNPQPLATEESEHARQLKPAQPLSTAIPSLPQWTNTPVLSGLTFDAQIERAENSGHTEQAEWLRKQKALQDKAHKKNIDKHPIATGVGEGVGETAEGLTTPANLALMITAPESKIMSGLFAIQALHGSYKDVEEARKAYREGNNAEASKYATQAILNLGIAGLAGHHAVKDIPVPEPVKAFMADETGSVTNPLAPNISDVKAKAAELKPTTAYKSVDQSQPFYLKSENLITEKMKGPMPAEDVHKMLLSNGVKPEEMKWTGLDELLQGKGKQKVTPQEIQEHLAGNNLQVQEVQKESDQGNLKSNLVSQYNSFVHVANKDLGIQAERVADEIEAGKEDSETIIRRHVPNPSPRLLEAGKTLYETGKQVAKAREAGPTKFGSYALPGAEPGSYRELLVTMPPKNTMPSFEEWSKANGYGDHEGARNLYERIRSGEARDTTGNANQFRSSHWDEPNVLGHVRFNDRTGPNGERILHLEELQSDWHQKGRTAGYGGEEEKGQVLEAQKQKMNEADRAYGEAAEYTRKTRQAYMQHEASGTILTPEGQEVRAESFGAIEKERQAFNAREDAREEYNRAYAKLGKVVPDAPFKKTWPELLLKRMMKYASDNNYSGISWTPGDLQAERYDLSKQVDAIHYRSAGPRMFSVEAYRQGIGTVLSQTGTPEELEEVVGKDIVRKMIAGEGNEVGGPGNFRKLTGVDLKVGGEGMKGFYDKIIPDAANKLGKQWGAKVGETKISVPSLDPHPRLRFAVQDESGAIYSQANTRDEIDVWLATRQREFPRTNFQIIDQGEPQAPSNKTTVPYLPITPQMRAGVKSIPYSLFSIPLAAGALTLQQVKAKGDELQKKFKPTGVAQ